CKLRELESTIITLREKLKVVERVFNTLRDKESSLNALRELLDRKSSELTTLTERAENLCREHGVHRESIGECLVELSKLSEDYSKCKAELESLRGLYAEIVIAESPEELLRRLMGISTLGLQIPVDLSINSARQLVSELGRVRDTLLRKYEEETKRLTELKAKLERLRGQLESTRSQLEEYESDVKRLGGDVERLKKRIEAYEALEEFSEKYLGKSGVIARELTRVARVELENRANTVLSRLGLREISIGEGFELYVKLANGLLPIDNASGGERVAVAIALRLALAELAMGKSPTVLILDEPTVHLDDERRTQVFSIIGELSKSLRQVIVVTHDEKVVDIADTVIRVENLGDISEVTVEKTVT
ncbi:MAG: AAA family ATPase, partial [Desulfurococcaceae archaeon]